MNPRDITQVDVDYYDESDAEIVIGRALITGPGRRRVGYRALPCNRQRAARWPAARPRGVGAR
jgi:hypothetical protein